MQTIHLVCNFMLGVGEADDELKIRPKMEMREDGVWVEDDKFGTTEFEVLDTISVQNTVGKSCLEPQDRVEMRCHVNKSPLM